MADEGKLYWSKAGAFYRTGTSGQVAPGRALPSLRYDERLGRFRDELGRFVPKSTVDVAPKTVREYVARDAEGRPFLSTMITDESVSEQAARTLLDARQVGSNQQVVIRDIITDGKGNVYEVNTSTTLGGRTRFDTLLEQADKRAKGTLWEKQKINSGRWRPDMRLSRTIVIRTVSKPSIME